jgi:hypothetical protein
MQYHGVPAEVDFDTSQQALDQSPSARLLEIRCSQCLTHVGLYNVLASSVMLFKWQVVCSTRSSQPVPTGAHCLATTLTATISQSASSKSALMPHTLALKNENERSQTDSPWAIHIWVLSPHLVYSSSVTDSRTIAMKVLFQSIEITEAEKLTDSMTSGVQEIRLPSSLIESTWQLLQTSNSLLPNQDRKFQGWSVGLLERWVG